MTRPKGIEVTTWLMVFSLLLGLTNIATHWNSTANIHIKPGSKATVHSVLMFVRIGSLVCEAVSAFCVVFYWKGRNWARILVLMTSCLSLYSVLKLPRYWNMSGVICIEYVFDAMLGLYLLWYLFQPDIRAWFKEQATAAAPAQKSQAH